MSSSKPTLSSMVGRDELAALLGASHASDMVAAAGANATDSSVGGRGGVGASGRHRNTGSKNDADDVSKMDRVQAAALVAKQFGGNKSAGANSGLVRHRASGKRKRTMQHHLLAGDLLEEAGNSENDVVDFYGGRGKDTNEEDEDETFAIRKETARGRRKKTEAKVLLRRKGDKQERGSHASSHSDSDSSSQSSNSFSSQSSNSRGRRSRKDNRRRRRRSRSGSTSSSSASEDEADRRRRRARERSQQNRDDNRDVSSHDQNWSKSEHQSGSETDNLDERAVETEGRAGSKQEKKSPRRGNESNRNLNGNKHERNGEQGNLLKEDDDVLHRNRQHGRRRRSKSQDSSSSDDSSSSASSQDSSTTSSSSSSSSSQDSIENAQPAHSLGKPLFVPKSQRGTISELELQQKKVEEAEERRSKERDKRALQSRALVAEVISEAGKSSSSSAGIGEDEFEGGEEGRFIFVPDDTDPTEEDSPDLVLAARDAWEVRELARVLRDIDESMAAEKERKDLERRRAMTDKERLEEDRRTGRYRAPGEARRLPRAEDGTTEERGTRESKYLQRYHHRGAFYLDEDTLAMAGKDDVRHRAAEYSRAATGEDKIDKSKLPEVMQVKKFGFAGYSTKYKGLAKEDTTDKKLDFLPVTGLGSDRRGEKRLNKSSSGRHRDSRR